MPAFVASVSSASTRARTENDGSCEHRGGVPPPGPRALESHCGTPFELAGDSRSSLFADAKDAVLAAVAVRDALREQEWAEVAVCPAVRVGVHTGRVADPDAGQLGIAAMRVGQLCTVAEPWQVLVSHTTYALLEGQPLDDASLRDLGERKVFGDHGPARVFEAFVTTAG